MKSRFRRRLVWSIAGASVLALSGVVAYAYFIWPTPYAYAFDRSVRISRLTCIEEARDRDGDYRRVEYSPSTPQEPGFTWSSLTSDFYTLYCRIHGPPPRWTPPTPMPPFRAYTLSEVHRQNANLHKVWHGMTEKQVEHLMGKCKNMDMISSGPPSGRIIQHWYYAQAEIDLSGGRQVVDSVNGR